MSRYALEGIKIDVNDIIGKKFGRLTPIAYHHTEYHEGGQIKKHYYLCKCDCGNEKLVSRPSLLRGTVLSCGCLLKESNASEKRPPSKQAHNLGGTRFYNIFSDMHKRCGNPNNKQYPWYGGRGISFDFPWLVFNNFYNDMYPSYLEHCAQYGEKDTTLDRIDPDGMYCKDNCRWATRAEQSNNRRNTYHVEYQGETYTFSDLLNNFPHHPDVDNDLLCHRVIHSGWDIDKALSTPKLKQHEKRHGEVIDPR